MTPQALHDLVAARGPVVGVTRPLHAGRRCVVVQTDVRDAAERRVAQVARTQAGP